MSAYQASGRTHPSAVSDGVPPPSPAAVPGRNRASGPDGRRRDRRGGRPPKDPATVRSGRISFRVTPAVYERVVRRADKAGLSLTEFAEAAITGDHPALRRTVIPPINRAVWGDLGQIGGNLNQLAKHLNRGHVLGSPTALRRELEALRRQLQSVRMALIGVGDLGRGEAGP